MKQFTDKELKQLEQEGARVKTQKKVAKKKPPPPTVVAPPSELKVPDELWSLLADILNAQKTPAVVNLPKRGPVTIDFSFEHNEKGRIVGATAEVRPRETH